MTDEVNKIEIYTDVEGKVPFLEWHLSLKDRKAASIVLNRIDRLKIGNLGYCPDLADGVWEMKIDFGPGYRVYFARSGKTVYLLLAGGDKSTQKANIKEAKRRWQEYQKRKSVT
jgi:putative addiction module killer protein